MQCLELSSSDDRLFGEEDNFHSRTRTVVVGTYNQLSSNCVSRIYSAIFHSTTNTVEINYSNDKTPHCYDPKAYIIDGYYIATYCLPSEETILKNVFNTEPFLSWKLNQLANPPNNVLNQDPYSE